MPSINNIALPVVKLEGETDLDALSKALEKEEMPLEAMIEVAIYLKREQSKVDGLKAIQDGLRDRIKAIMDKLPPEQRETRRVNVGMATYAEARDVLVLKDRDWTVENLTNEQIRITYQPNLKNLETILKKDELARHTTVERKGSTVAIKEEKGVTTYEELDF